jgi:hypothetical protein
MVLAGSCRLPAGVIVRIILPILRKAVTATHRIRREKTRKIRE